ncbi:MAG: hypothetical protein K2O91_09960 [Lachnospiraceae bacterium]|nr:hypothetical protein [Lachnospiraceae bacterium]
MMFDKIKAVTIHSEEIMKLVGRAQELTRGSYDLYDQNYKPLSAILKKLLKLAKQEGEWYLYFDAIDELMYLDHRDNNYAEIVKYAEVYYKDSAQHMDKEIPNYPDVPMAYLNVWIYDKIFDAYYQYYQIDDAKMDSFMKKYEEAALKYGKTYAYYWAELNLSMLYRDVNRAEAAARNFLVYEKEIESCYVCGHLPYLLHFLLVGQDQKAEELMLDYIHKNIPKKHLWCYKYCQRAEPDSMYLSVMEVCVRCGRKESFLYFYNKYWKELPLETRCDPDAGAFQRLLCAFAGCFDQLENDLKTAAEWIERENKDTTVNNMYTCMELWCYFTLLDRSGVHAVEISLPGLETDEAGQTASLVVSDYMQEKADTYGGRFAQVRRQFDYGFVKASYQKCFL